MCKRTVHLYFSGLLQSILAPDDISEVDKNHTIPFFSHASASQSMSADDALTFVLSFTVFGNFRR